ncbi:MAG: hypothetical protein IPK83_21420 [Planctomycetes bacterium]|nr:hypothetical protein [Planctomycetota bacterium]
MLADGEPDVVIAALNVVADRDQLSMDDLRPLLEANDAQIRRMAYYHAAGHLSPQKGFRPTASLLHDADEVVRGHVVEYAAKWRLRELVPALIDRLEVEEDVDVQRGYCLRLGKSETRRRFPR